MRYIDVHGETAEAKAEWSRSPAVRAEFAQNEQAYVAFRLAQARGLARSVTNKSHQGAAAEVAALDIGEEARITRLWTSSPEWRSLYPSAEAMLAEMRKREAARLVRERSAGVRR